MVLTDTIRIDRPPAEVWRCIQDPSLMKAWNRNIRAVVNISPGKPAAGYRFRVRYCILGREGNFLAEFMEYEEPGRLLMHLTGGNLPVKGYVQEHYALSEIAGGTLLRQRLYVNKSGMNMFTICLVFCSHYLGRLAGRSVLKGLKEFVEGRSCMGIPNCP